MRKIELTQEEWNKITPGNLFAYKGPRRFPFLSESYGLGCIVFVDWEKNIVGVRTLSETNDGDITIDIGFMPILLSKFVESTSEIMEERVNFGDISSTINDWHKAGQGCFLDTIYKSWKLTYDTAALINKKFSEQTQYIGASFPVLGSDDEFKTIRVIILDR